MQGLNLTIKLHGHVCPLVSNSASAFLPAASFTLPVFPKSLPLPGAVIGLSALRARVASAEQGRCLFGQTHSPRGRLGFRKNESPKK